MECGQQALAQRHIKSKIAAEMAGRKDLGVVGAPLVSGGADDASDHWSQHAERVEHPQRVLPNVGALAEAAQCTVLLVDAHAPAFLRESQTGGQPRDAAAGDLDRALHVANPTGTSSRQTV